MNEPPPQTDPAPSSDLDLYCLKCGYNLRGLSGDPRRCPECGHENPMGDITLPAPLIRQQLQELETGPVTCVFAALGMIVAAAGGWMLYRAIKSPDVAQGVCVVVGAAFLFFAALWVQGLRLFQRSCLDKPGWPAVLWRFHALGSGLVIAFIVVLNAGLAPNVSPVWLAALAAIMAAEYAAYRAFYAGIRARMDELQREVAVEIARDLLRRRLTDARRASSR